MELFNHKHPIYKELDRLGYIPPKCQSVEILLKPYQPPTIVIRATATDELARIVRQLRHDSVRVDVHQTGDG
jgi:hypothetical protein